MWLLKEPFERKREGRKFLASETVEGAALSLEGVDHIHGSDGLPLGVLRVGDCVADHVLKEHLQHPAGLLVDQARDSLHAATAGQATDGGLGDPLDVVAKDLPVALGASLSETFASFAASRHSCSRTFELFRKCFSMTCVLFGAFLL